MTQPSEVTLRTQDLHHGSAYWVDIKQLDRYDEFGRIDARMDGGTYREIAEVLFGARQIPERAWKTHDLRNRTIRLVQTGFALMRGGYRVLLRPPSRKE